MQSTFNALRSLLYMPASNARALAKAQTLPCDAVILDLEDAVAPDQKDTARAMAVAASREGGFGGRTVVIRINAPDTSHGRADIEALHEVEVPVLVPKVGDAQVLEACARELPGRPLWAMIETTRAILNIAEIAACARTLPLSAFVFGANDLASEMSCRTEDGRRALWAALSLMVMAGRSQGLAVFDAVYNDISDEEGFTAECAEGEAFGCNGKTLIHPSQIETCNRIFSPSGSDVDWARMVVEAFCREENAEVGALRIDGRMVERLHLVGAESVLARARA